ncbi:MAG: helicase-associated domain-containing protein [Deltaproteobacteria bacterium]|nr:helicase-associated domain-containing protein [Deltaproteobacteria bacterium]
MKRYDADEGIATLEVALSDYMNADDLKKLAALTGEKLPTRKADLAAVIVRHLDGDRLRAAWQGLEDLQRAAVAEVVHSSSSRFRADRFGAKYGAGPEWGSTEEQAWRRRPSALCLFFYGNGTMPDDLKERLKAFVPAPAPAKIETLDQLPASHERPYTRWNSKTKTQEQVTEEVPLTVRETERTAQRELLSVLRLVDAGKVAVSDTTRRPSSATIAALTAILEGGDYYAHVPARNKWEDKNAGPIRAFAWPLLVQAGGLAQLSGTRLQLTKAGRRALGETAAETIRTLWARWVGTTILDELSRIECVKGQTGKGKRGLTAPLSRRRPVAEALAECPAGGWITTDEFLRFARASGHDFSVTRNAWNLYIGELQYGSLGQDGGAGILEERYVLCLLLEYAATLGLIDVALVPPAGARDDYGDLWGTDDLPFFSRYDGLMYLRLTPLGAYCLGREAVHRPAPVEVKPVLRVLPNLEIAAIGTELEQADRLALDAYATRVSDFVWRLDAGRLLVAIEEGRSMTEIREFLAARSGDPIPDTVVRLLQDVAERSAKVRDRGLARLVECADAALAALIANDTRTRKYCLRAGERHLAVPASAETAFRRGLREVGYLLAAGETRGAGVARAGSPDDPAPERGEA